MNLVNSFSGKNEKNKHTQYYPYIHKQYLLVNVHWMWTVYKYALCFYMCNIRTISVSSWLKLPFKTHKLVSTIDTDVHKILLTLNSWSYNQPLHCQTPPGQRVGGFPPLNVLRSQIIGFFVNILKFTWLCEHGNRYKFEVSHQNKIYMYHWIVWVN